MMPEAPNVTIPKTEANEHGFKALMQTEFVSWRKSRRWRLARHIEREMVASPKLIKVEVRLATP
jgi:hypothetical protein